MWASQVALVVKNPPANVGDVKDVGSIPGSGRSPEGGHSNPFQYSCLENPIDRGPWWATGHMVTKSQTRLKELNTRTHSHTHTHMLQQASDSFKIGVWIKISRGETSSEDKKQLQRASDFLIEILGSKASEKSLYCMHQQTAEWVRML